MTRVYLGIGSNLSPREHITAALEQLADRFGALTISPVYACPAVGFDGPDFLNLVVGLDTGDDAAVVARDIRGIETACGRDRVARTGSRTLDLDLLLYGDLICRQLKLPRADILCYAFTLKPLADLAPQARHPQNGETYAALWAGFDATGQPLTVAAFQPGQ